MRPELQMLARQRGRLFPWIPVFYGAGIGLYLALRLEPSRLHYGLAIGLLALCICGARRSVPDFAPILIAGAALLSGFLVAGAPAHLVKAPVLGFRYYGPVEGRIVATDRSHSDRLRLTLDNVVLRYMPAAATPARVRVSLHGDQDYLKPEPGMVVGLTAHLAPPGGPVEPGGFDFRRMAWFQQLGAVGYTRVPALAIEPSGGGAGLWIARLRHQVARSVRGSIGGEAGNFAAAITTGDRSGISKTTLENLRISNLAHLLAISGLHMGLLVGIVFATIRYGLALALAAALRWPVKKIAAIAALLAGGGYLALSGGNVATLRAYVMVSVMLLAVLLDRRALTLRSVALAASVILTLRPDSLLSPGFQMSFAATTALVAVFEMLREVDSVRISRAARPVLATILSSAVAGPATAPFAAAHFNQISHYGLVANILSVPVMGLVVMPAAVLAGALSLTGLEQAGFWGMKAGISWILSVSRHVAELDGAVSHVTKPGWPVLPVLALGLLLLVIWKGALRYAGIAIAGGAFFLWSQTLRPDILISSTGGLIGVMGSEGRALSAGRGDGFAAQIWLENDGAPATQADAHARPGIDWADEVASVSRGGLTIRHLRRKADLSNLGEYCRDGVWIVTNAALDDVPRPCKVLDRDRLKTHRQYRDTRNSARDTDDDGGGTDRQASVVGSESAGSAGSAGSVNTDQPHQTPLNLYRAFRQHPRFIGGIRGLQRDHVSLAAETFQRCLVALYLGDHDVAITDAGGFANHHHIAVIDAGPDHRVTLDLQRIVPVCAGQHLGGNTARSRAVFDRLYRLAGGNAAKNFKLHRVCMADRLRARRGAVGPVALDDARREAFAAKRVGKPEDFNRPRPMRKAAYKAPLLQRGDQAVNPGFRAQIKRFLHFIKGWRYPVAGNAPVYEFKEFQLLSCQHDQHLRPPGVFRSIPVRRMFYACSCFVSTCGGRPVMLQGIPAHRPPAFQGRAADV